MIKYGLFCYDTENIGDEVQSIAARRFLPRVDYYIPRDEIDKFAYKSSDSVKIIMNGWYTHKPENWPPKNPAIHPLLISIHVEQEALEGRAAKAFISEESKSFLKKYGPVGARNLPTLEFFKKNGIDAYFSGCVTLTLNPDKNIKKQDFVLAVDVSQKVLSEMKKRTKRPIIEINTVRAEQFTTEEKFSICEYWLFLYQSAHAVVTERLHCMLPCLALGTPVLAISGRDPNRYAGLIDLTNHMTEKEFIDGKKYNLDNPPANPKDYLKIRKTIEKRCKEYTNYDSGRSFLNGKSQNELLVDPGFIKAMSSFAHKSCVAEYLRREYDKLYKDYAAVLAERDYLIEEAKKNPGLKESLRLVGSAVKRKIVKR